MLPAALLGTQSVLFSKALSLLLRTTIQGNSQLGSWFVWINLMAFIVAAAFWVTRLNMVSSGQRNFTASPVNRILVLRSSLSVAVCER